MYFLTSLVLHQHGLSEGHNPAVSVRRPVRTSGMNASELGCVQSQYASVQFSDGANTNAMATIGSIRGSAHSTQTQVANPKTGLVLGRLKSR
jgi:hypothetical protein